MAQLSGGRAPPAAQDDLHAVSCTGPAVRELSSILPAASWKTSAGSDPSDAPNMGRENSSQQVARAETAEPSMAYRQ